MLSSRRCLVYLFIYDYWWFHRQAMLAATVPAQNQDSISFANVTYKVSKTHGSGFSKFSIKIQQQTGVDGPKSRNVRMEILICIVWTSSHTSTGMNRKICELSAPLLVVDIRFRYFRASLQACAGKSYIHMYTSLMPFQTLLFSGDLKYKPIPHLLLWPPKDNDSVKREESSHRNRTKDGYCLYQS